MATRRQTAINLGVTVNATGFALSGGTTEKGITVEDTSVVNQDLTTDASPQFAGLTLVNAITEFSTDGTMSGNSDSAVPTEAAVVTYVNAQTFPWTVKTDDFNAAVDNGYICNDTAVAALICTLPATAAVGDEIKIRGMGSQGWVVTAAAGDTIQFGNLVTIAAGSISSVDPFDCISLICVTADTAWLVTDSVGSLDVEIS